MDDLTDDQIEATKLEYRKLVQGFAHALGALVHVSSAGIANAIANFDAFCDAAKARRVNALRYEWVREHPGFDPETAISPEQYDAAVDAEMQRL